jgi:chromosome segregation ATPase
MAAARAAPQPEAMDQTIASPVDRVEAKAEAERHAIGRSVMRLDWHVADVRQRVDWGFDSIANRVELLTRRFDAMGLRFDAIHRRIDASDSSVRWIDRRFEGMDRRFERLQRDFAARVEGMDRRFDMLQRHFDGRLNALDRRIDALQRQLESGSERRHEDLAARLETMSRRVDALVSALRREQPGAPGADEGAPPGFGSGRDPAPPAVERD